ncbi:MAG: O-antigen ligase family protein [Planctomycetaceae bacterium]
MSFTANSIRMSRSRRAATALPAGAVGTAVRLLDGVGQLCLLTAVLIVPLTMAGIREVGTALFIAASLTMGVAWSIRQLLKADSDSSFSGAEIIILLAIVLVVVQMIHLPISVLNAVAPFSRDYLPMWRERSGESLAFGTWSTISLTPAETRSGLVLLMAYGVFFLTLVQMIRKTEDVDRIIRLLAISCVLMAFIGLVQLFFGNGLYLGFIRHPYRSADWPAKGTFTNQNHFAHFLALGLGPLIWVWHQRSSSGQSASFSMKSGRSAAGSEMVLKVLIGVVVLAGILSFSRGGILSMLLACGLTLHAFRKHGTRLLRLLPFAAAFVVLAVISFGTGALKAKWLTISDAQSFSDLSSGRFALWSALWKALPHFCAAGSGLGSHAEVYPTWMKQQFFVRFSHAESGYLQVLLELGIPGLCLLVSGIGLAGFWVIQAWRSSDLNGQRRVAVLASGLLVSVVHSIADFVWYIPGCMILTLVCLAATCRCFQISRQRDKEKAPSGRRPWPGFLAYILIVLSVPMAKLSADVAGPDAYSEADRMACRDGELLIGDRITHLEKAVRTDPADYLSMATLSALYLDRFEERRVDSANSMSVLEIRATVRSVDFESHREIAEWLLRAFGEDARDLYRSLKTARSSLRGQPLRPEPYLILSQLGFLIGISDADCRTLLDQALLLQPSNPAVLFRAGLSRAEAGELDEACELLSAANAADYRLRPVIVGQMAPYLSAREFIERIRPGSDTLWFLMAAYRSGHRSEDAAYVAAWFSEHFEELRQADAESDHQFWRRADEFFTANSEPDRAIACLERAVEQFPRDYGLRRRFALNLKDSGEFEESLRQLKWCQLRRADDPEVLAAICELQPRQTTRGPQ